MKRKTPLPELLAPAGDMEALYAAVAGGADAVYVGGKLFSARAYAKNFDLAELEAATVYCHLCGVRLYVTVNTLVYDREYEELTAYAKELCRIGVDALIIADLGAIRAIRKAAPTLALHASTQMSLHNSEAVSEAEALGCERAVLARECSLKDICSAVENSPCEIEVFLHGALCVCHSGQCLFSSLVGGRSGNRGECAQPCRLPYNSAQSYPLSLSDLSLASHIGALISSGVSSLKIEGRMKSPDYVYRVTSVYRRLLDEHRDATEREKQTLAEIFSRGGFTDGYFTGHPEKKMTGIRSEADKDATRSAESGVRVALTPKKFPLSAVCKIEKDRPATLTLSDGHYSESASIGAPTEAKNQPLTEESVKARLAKTGNTPYSLSPEAIALSLGEGLFLSPGEINALRRAATDALLGHYKNPLEKTSVAAPAEKSESAPENIPLPNGDLALFFDPSLPDKLGARLARFGFVFVPLFTYKKRGEPTVTSFSPRVNGVYLPPVVMDHEREEVKAALRIAKEKGIRFALVGNLGGAALAKEAGLCPIGDFRLNVCSRETLLAYRNAGIPLSVLSPELTLPMARDVLRAGDAAVAVAGRIPLMLTERCFMRENFGCDKCSACSFTDRKGEKFPLVREYPHRNLILNSQPTYMGDRKADLEKAGVRRGYFLFTTESEAEAREILDGFEKGSALAGKAVRRVGKREHTQK